MLQTAIIPEMTITPEKQTPIYAKYVIPSMLKMYMNIYYTFFYFISLCDSFYFDFVLSRFIMCGIVGIHSNVVETNQITYEMLEALMAVQHRGQDSVGISIESRIIKHPGLVKYAFQHDDLSTMSGHNCIGHVRYATNTVIDHIQPIYMSLPRRITLCHNGNIRNIETIREILYKEHQCISKTLSDSELILQLFCCELYKYLSHKRIPFTNQLIQEVIDILHSTLDGSYSLLILIEDYGMIAVRDPKGIRPLVWASKSSGSPSQTHADMHMIASESVAPDLVHYKIQRDVYPGETIIFQNKGPILHYRTKRVPCALEPCVFEYLYFARTDSIIERISVHNARIQIGRTLAQKMLRDWSDEICKSIDVIVPVPDTSITFANGIHDVLRIPVREGFVKNRYIDRTFIMQSSQLIQKSIKRKLCGIPDVFRDKCILIVDDSIVRGNTSAHIVQMAREYGAKKVFFASCSPIVRETNEYGIYIPTKKELVSHERNQEEIGERIGVDSLIFHDLCIITELLKQMNSSIQGFETSMFLRRNSVHTHTHTHT